MAELTESVIQRFLSAVEERQRSLEGSFREFKSELRAETLKVEATAQKIETAVHMIDKNVASLEAANLPKRLDQQDTKLEKHDERIKTLENWRFYMMGGLAVLGIVNGILVAVLIKVLF